MPNKHKNAKLRTKLLLSGKLNKKKEVQSTLKYLKEKDALDKEDINFDFETEKNDFGTLDAEDDDTRKLKTPKKRKNQSNGKGEIKKPKFDEKPEPIKNNTNKTKKSDTLVPKKSKKNKYFFMAHPEAFDKKDEIVSEQDKNKFIIDEEKIKANIVKKQKNSNLKKETPDVKKKDTKEKKDKLWILEECTSESEDEEKKKKIEKPKKKQKALVLDLDDIDRNFTVKKIKKKLEDGSYVEVFAPGMVQNDDDEEDEDESDDEQDEQEPENESEEEQEDPKKDQKENFASPMIEKLKSSRFRYLNELLYTQESSKSFEFFKNDEESFTAYHDGFKAQASKWPINPLDQIIRYIKSRPANLVVADFGCGEARLAQSVKNKVHSFDLVAVNDLVVRCDMKKVPLESASCDIAVFCLSLMGTNVVDFLAEAHRILKLKGVLKIAEVVSRIKDKLEFIKNIESMGFKLVSKKDEISKSDSKDYFYFFDFVKMSPSVKKRPKIKINPCFYKKR